MMDEAAEDAGMCGGCWYLLLGCITVVIYIFYNKLTTPDNWEKYGVKQGTMGLVSMRDGFSQLLAEHGDTVGIVRSKMLLVTRDLTLLREVLVRDFSNFVDREGTHSTRSVIAKGLFFLQGQDWKRMRQIVTPSFSSVKMKHMSKTVEERAIKLTQVLEDYARQGKLLPIKDISVQFTSEIIARTVFGFSTNSLGGADDEFTAYSKQMFRVRGRYMAKLMPLIMRFEAFHRFCVQVLNIKLLDGFREDSEVYFKTILKRSLEERKEMEVRGEKVPQDFLQSLIQAKAAGDRGELVDSTDDIDDDMSRHSVSRDKLPKTMSSDELMGQSLVVILAGFETTAITLQLCLYLLAKHPDVQDKICDEIERVVQGETPTYEELQQLTYIEQVINETLRLYPPAPIMSRKAAQTKTYGKITIPKGAGVWIPIFAILTDPKHYPDPEKFDPERFSEKNTAKRDPMAFMPFGYGPRICIGMRLALLELKMALATLLRKVRVELNEETEPKKGEDVVIKTAGFIRTEKPLLLAVKLRSE
ncbi:cytochrome P450 3A24-like [Physella acuta]|uniref:cytochrome P450 3A24-like n=1 Tax=Physella acuta TaxID=109671 RepID=UPI0027DCB406|nr:cytochrome P450 3A24-like [Physella acuta]XP_059172328.1 cytochrome P450 3A24-like [Physella acuta]XP_059172329.1 cytochrome P450 3A24-like [Physella acuta]